MVCCAAVIGAGFDGVAAAVLGMRAGVLVVMPVLQSPIVQSLSAWFVADKVMLGPAVLSVGTTFMRKTGQRRRSFWLRCWLQQRAGRQR